MPWRVLGGKRLFLPVVRDVPINPALTCNPCGQFNVLDYGADPTGVGNSTAAFQAAILNSPASSTIYVPQTAAGGTYRINADTLAWHSRIWKGDFLDSFLRTRIVAATAGTWLARSTSLFGIENMEFDCQGIVARGIQLDPAHGSLINNVKVTGATQYGVFVEEGTLRLRRVELEGNAQGIYIIGSNGSNFYNVDCFDNTGVGAEIVGFGGGPTTLSGAIAWYGGVIRDNGGTEQFLVNGVQGSLLHGLTLIGAEDGMRLTNIAHDVLVTGCIFNGPETHVAVEYENARMCTFVGCAANGDDYRRIRKASALAGETVGFNNRETLEPNLLGYLRFSMDNGLGTVEDYDPHMNGLVALHPPTIGAWLAGTIIWNGAGGAPNGWRCTVTGLPGTWVAF